MKNQNLDISPCTEFPDRRAKRAQRREDSGTIGDLKLSRSAGAGAADEAAAVVAAAVD